MGCGEVVVPTSRDRSITIEQEVILAVVGLVDNDSFPNDDEFTNPARW